jgi:hypothetical protein
MPDLIRFIHKSTFGVGKVVKIFRTHWGATISTDPPKTLLSQTPNRTSHPPSEATPESAHRCKIESTPISEEYENASNISKYQMEKKIKAIAVKEIRPPISKAVWYVHDAVLKQYGLEKENFTPLYTNGTALLTTTERASINSATPETPNQQRVPKRKLGHAGKSLLDFLKSPKEKSQIFSPPKRMKIDPSSSVICIDVDDSPPTKRPHLVNMESETKEGEINTTSTMDQDVITLDLPDLASDVASEMVAPDNLASASGHNQGIQCP